MKKMLLMAVLAACSTTLFAQKQGNVLKFNVFSPLVKTLNISYERALSPTNSIQIGAAITGASIGDTKFSGVTITPEYRFYISDDEAPEGFYIAPFARYQNLSLEVEDDVDNAKANLTGGGIGAVLGKQWLFGANDKVGLEIFLGPSYSFGSLEVKSGDETQFETGSFDGVGIRFGLNFGFAF